MRSDFHLLNLEESSSYNSRYIGLDRASSLETNRVVSQLRLFDQ